MNQTTMTGGSKTRKTFEVQDLQSASTKSVSENTSSEKKVYKKIFDINDVLRMLAEIKSAKESDSLQDIEAFCIKAIVCLQANDENPEDKSSFKKELQDKESMKEFMYRFQKFLFSVIWSMGNK